MELNNLFQYFEELTRKFKKNHYTIGIELMVHAIDTKHRVSLLTARGSKDNHYNFIKEINAITGRYEGNRDYFINDDLYAKRLDWLGNNSLKKLHVIIEHLLGIKFDGKKVFGVENRKSKLAYFYDDEEKNLKILDEPLWSMYIDKVKFYIKEFTDIDKISEQKEIIDKIQKVKNNIKIININKVNDDNIEKYKKQISLSPIDTIHFFDIDGTLTSLKLEIDILKDGKKIFVITQEEFAEKKELFKTNIELSKDKIQQRENYKKEIGITNLTNIIQKAIKGNDGYSINLDEFREKDKIDRQITNEPFKRRKNINESINKTINSEKLKKREIIKKIIKEWEDYSIE